MSFLFSLFYANERHANELICIFKQFENKMICQALLPEA